MGDLYVQDRDPTSSPTWKAVGPALGRVVIPEKQDLRLVIPPGQFTSRVTIWQKVLRAIGFKPKPPAVDLSPLVSVDPDSLRELFILDIPVSDEELAPLGRLRSLQWLVVRDSRISQAGLAHLDDSTRLRILFVGGYDLDNITELMDNVATSSQRLFDYRYDPTNGVVSN